MPKVLILSLVFGPDTVSTANMMTELAQGLEQRGHQVTVLTSMPHYNPSPSVLNNPVYRAGLLRLYTESFEKGVRVLRVYMPLKRQRVWRRVMDYLWFHFITTLVALFKIPRQDIVFVPSPPITLGLSGFFVCLLLKARLIYDVRELWPDVPVRMGLIRNSLLLRFIYGVEGYVYQHSAAITSIARTFIKSLIQRGVPTEKLYFTPNFVNVQWLIPGVKANGFAVEHSLDDKFVVFYAGNIGLTQGLDILVDVARDLQQDPQIVILIVGDGAERPKLQQAIESAHLKNVLLLPFQPYERIPQTYATADVCISPMRFGFSYDTVPSKIYTAMAAGRPVVCAAESDSESAALLRESHAGVVVSPESAREMAQAILELRQSPETAQRMGINARRWVVDHYSQDAVIATYDQVLRQVATSLCPLND